MIHRRELLGLSTSAVLFAVSGCTEQSSSDVEKVQIENWHSEPHSLTVVIDVGGEERLSREVVVPETTTEEGSTTAGRKTIDEELPGPEFLREPRYEVTIELDGETATTMEKTLRREFDTLRVVIDEDTSVDAFFEKAV